MQCAVPGTLFFGLPVFTASLLPPVLKRQGELVLPAKDPIIFF